MRVAMVTWEYPPLVVGGISPHVDGLSAALAAAGHDVTVLTFGGPELPADETIGGVRVLRAPIDEPWLPAEDFLARMASANHRLVQLLAALGSWRPDIVHAHDWLSAWAGDTLATLCGAPLVATVHATERGRGGGHVAPGQPSGISSVEWWLTYRAREVIACSRFMVREVTDAFSLPPAKVHGVPNGVDADLWAPPSPAPHRNADGPLVVAWGRVQQEKGFQTLVEAASWLRHDVPGLRVVVAGRGSHLDALHGLAQHLGVGDLVHFAGFVPDAELRSLLHRAGAVVIPSFYEPFGIVALEALAARAPLVASSAGGLGEILGGTDAARLFEPGDVGALAHHLRELLLDPSGAKAQQEAGEELVRTRYTWRAIAEATVGVYERACGR